MTGKKEPSEIENTTNAALKRRHFLGALAGVTTTSLIAGRNATAEGLDLSDKSADIKGSSENHYDAIVIGGGFAGVTAARDLSLAGASTLLIEARDRLGGRTYTSDFGGDEIEFGGTWVHNTQPFVWSEMQRYGIGILETPGAVAEDFRWIDANGTLHQLNLEQFESLASGWQTYHAEGRYLLPRPFDLMHNREAILANDTKRAIDHLGAMPLDALQKDFIETMISLFGHCKAEDTAYLEMLRFHVLGGDYFPTLMDATTRFQIDGGTQRLIRAMVEEGNFQSVLNTPVQALTQTESNVLVQTVAGKNFSAKHVVCSAPMNTLNDIRFDPPLPAGLNAMSAEKHPGIGHKIFMKITSPIANFSVFSPHQQMHYAMTYKLAKDHAIVVAFANTDGGLDVTDNDSLQKALRQYVPDATVVASTSHNWVTDEFSKGTWATFRPGWLTAYGDQTAAQLDRIHFASGDLGEGWRGTIDGAIRGGKIAARSISEKLKG